MSEAMLPAAVAGLALIAVTAAAIAVSYNRFISQRAGIDSAWAGIDVQLQRRHDLVPRLVEVVEGYAAHEKGVLVEVTRARAAAVEADQDPSIGPRAQAQAEDRLTGAAHRLVALSEQYPDLKASQHFLDLQAQLVETEDRIAASRRLYNLEVRDYNRRVGSFPSNLIASQFGFITREYFEAGTGAAEAPRAVREGS